MESPLKGIVRDGYDAYLKVTRMQVNSPVTRSYRFSEVRTRLLYEELRCDAERHDAQRAELLSRAEAVGNKIGRRYGPAVREALVNLVTAHLIRGDTGGADACRPRTSRPANCGRGKNVEARMLKLVSQNTEVLDWSAQDWATRLGCSRGTVCETAVWTEYIPFRQALERGERGKRAAVSSHGRKS